MQVTQTLDEGLKREFKIVVPASDLDARLNERLDGLKDRVNINGFRKGKVPLAHLKKLYGKSVMAEVLDQVVAEANKKIVDDNGLKLAMQPKVKVTAEDESDEQQAVLGVIEGKHDLSLSVAMEVLPKVELKDVAELKVERLVTDVEDKDVEETLDRVASSNRPFAAKDGAAANGDRVTIDFVGKMGGEPFEGGSAEGHQLELGSNSFIPGFEDQLVGAKAGDEKAVTVSFPEAYPAAELAGKEATFDVKVHAVETPGEVKIDDELAKGLGFEDVAKLKDAVREQIGTDYARVSRQKLKRQLLDGLDAQYAFDLPPTLVEQEFDNVWRQVIADLAREGRTLADEDTSEDEAKAEYRKIAERRVRLGLVLAEIGEKHEIKVADDEVTRALVERARQYPGQEQQVWDFYRNNPEALAELRAPIFEDKVVDAILEKATVTERKVSRDELFATEDDEDGAEADKPKAKKASSKSAKSDAAPKKAKAKKSEGAADDKAEPEAGA
ncbi:trigger factor [Chelatococcus sambhunathii]|uniref:Trigger factor n=1 Tax=Chelatococcus sambhunathii TaxID=363953 RepID=A0ABU1DAM3_9HYPH|nr:trigger factor [Chelatococcus sambhunathii]MDR4305163.1 trigger factor [Chelatococcus sambhunathii]